MIKIGIDIDDTVVDFVGSFLQYHNERFGTNFLFSQITSNNIWDSLKYSFEEFKDILSDYHQTFNYVNMSFYPDFLSAFEELKNKRDLIFVTSRSLKNKEKTKKFFEKNILNFNLPIYHSGEFHGEEKITKPEICHKLGIGEIIEDNTHYAIDCAENGIKTYLISRLWNREYVEHENLIKVKDWYEILEKIK